MHNPKLVMPNEVGEQLMAHIYEVSPISAVWLLQHQAYFLAVIFDDIGAVGHDLCFYSKPLSDLGVLGGGFQGNLFRHGCLHGYYFLFLVLQNIGELL